MSKNKTVPPPVYVDVDEATNRLAYVAGLTRTEHKVVGLVLVGTTDKDIAAKIERSPRTVKRHVREILKKTKLKKRTALWAYLWSDGARHGKGPQ